MSRVSYLTKRGSVYYARIDVPQDLVAILNESTRKRSLKTKDAAEAKRRLWPVITDWQREFDDVRARRALVAADREHAVWDHYTSILERDEVERANLPGDAEIERIKADLLQKAERGEISGIDPLSILDATLELQVAQKAGDVSAAARNLKLAELRKHLAKGEMALIAHEVDAFLHAHRIFVDRGTPDWISLARHMMRAEIEALQRSLERDKGDYGGQPRDSLVKPPTLERRPRTETAEAGEGIMEVLEVFRNENPRNVSNSRIEESVRDIKIFIETVGPGFPVAKITKKHVREWKGLLVKYPVRATEVAAFRGMNIQQIVAANEDLKRIVLSDRTVNRYLSSLSAFCSWAEVNGYIASNPCTGMALPKERGSKTLPFTGEQLNALFSSPWFAGAQSDTEWHKIAKPGNVMIRDHRFWVPLIMLFSGARPGEIGQLAVTDVRLDHGHWIMHITTEGEAHEEGKSVKTAGSMRVVPLHPEILRLGFLSYHTERSAAGDKRLFPGAKRNDRGQMMADVSREFGKYLNRIGLKKGRGLSLYSFRHGAADALRRAGYLDEQFGFLLGHTKASMTGRYGVMPQGMLEQRVELVNAIAYPGLKLDHLVPKVSK
ncbi:MAG: tyrosine-type recombinase/integrase [Rhodobacteraceae bacterium]|nr:tyrosine-type recombinase/integrase [Paracoccaceae bacterium]